MISRRGFLLGGAGAVTAAGLAVATGVLPGRDEIRQLVGQLPAGVPQVSPGHQVSGSFASAAMHGAATRWTISYPPGQGGGSLPVLIALHGRGGNHTDAFAGMLHLDRFLAQTMHGGVRPFAVASVDGGDHSYWHPRRDSNASAMVIDEFLPLLRAHGLQVRRIGLLGWSMGGYGALYLSTVHPAARRLRRERRFRSGHPRPARRPEARPCRRHRGGWPRRRLLAQPGRRPTPLCRPAPRRLTAVKPTQASSASRTASLTSKLA